jgi:acetyl esterase/lipase
MVTGSVDGDDAKAAELARATNCVVVSVEYRLAPEHPYPAAIDDCFTALAWMAGGRHELGIDLRRTALYGPSAGGCLATATTLLARDRGGPEIACLVLVSPLLDDHASTPSSFANTGIRFMGSRGEPPGMGGVPGRGLRNRPGFPLRGAGAGGRLYVYPGGIHGGESLAPAADLTVRVRSRRHSALRRTLRVRSSAADHASP